MKDAEVGKKVVWRGGGGDGSKTIFGIRSGQAFCHCYARIKELWFTFFWFSIDVERWTEYVIWVGGVKGSWRGGETSDKTHSRYTPDGMCSKTVGLRTSWCISEILHTYYPGSGTPKKDERKKWIQTGSWFFGYWKSGFSLPEFLISPIISEKIDIEIV